MIPGVKRPCIVCGTLTDSGSRCPTHQSALNAQQDARRVGKRQHYGGDYARRAQAVRAAAVECWICHEGWRANDPWQADHVVPGDPDSPLAAAHRSCNIRRRFVE